MKRPILALITFCAALCFAADPIPRENLTRGRFTNDISPAPPIYSPTNVSWFGAKGDGATDDTTAITNAINAAGANATVFFEPGKTYKTTALITIPQDGMILSGYGATITSANATQWEKFQMTSRTGVQILGLKFSCLYATVSAQTEPVIDVLGSSDITIRDCTINDAPTGIRVTGTSTRVNIIDNRFYKNFCAIFTDDDSGNMPTRMLISGNQIQTGLGPGGTPFSGGIKMSGTGSSASTAGHVISNNVVDTTGQMGIELQTWINDCSISGNTVKGTDYGISISGCARVQVSGNNVSAVTYVGIEDAAGTAVSITGNVVSATPLVGSALISSSGTKCTISGCTLIGGYAGIYLLGHTTVVSGCMISGGRVAVRMLGGYDMTITGCYIDLDGAVAGQAIGFDATDIDIVKVNVVGNRFNGTTSDQFITFYTPNVGRVISDVTFSGNNTAGATSPLDTMWHYNVPTPITQLIRIRSYGNVGDGTTNAKKNFNVGFTATSSSMAFFYPYMQYEGGVVAIDATAGAKTFELPKPTGLVGYSVTVMKSDGSGNTVTVSSNGGGTINGSASLALGTQYLAKRFETDGTNWFVTN